MQAKRAASPQLQYIIKLPSVLFNIGKIIAANIKNQPSMNATVCPVMLYPALPTTAMRQ